MSGFKATRRGIEAIKQIRERELHLLEATTSFREAWMETKLGLVQSHFLY